MHSDARYDVIEQTRAAAEVAPEGFKLHWDFNHNRTMGVVLPIVAELERNYPVVGFIEDPLPWADIDGWRTLRQKTQLPLIMHNPQLGGMQEVLHGTADIYMIGGRIGETMRKGFAYGQANIQTLLQQSGNTLMKAFTLHQAAVLPTATAHIITLDDQYEDDITTSQLLPTEGFCRVPEGAGLGVEVDEEKLKAGRPARTYSQTRCYWRAPSALRTQVLYPWRTPMFKISLVLRKARCAVFIANASSEANLPTLSAFTNGSKREGPFVE